MNNLTKSLYIGSSSNLSRRFQTYFNVKTINNRRGRSIIYQAIIKYGYKAFNLYILEYCKKEELIKREQHYMDTLNPQYNILKVADSCLGREHTQETKIKMSLAKLGIKLTEETKTKMSLASLGLKHTEEAKAKMSKVKLGNQSRPKGYKHTEETIAKLKLAQQNRTKLPKPGISVKILDLKTNKSITYSSYREAARDLNMSPGLIHRRIKLDIKTPYKDRYIISLA